MPSRGGARRDRPAPSRAPATRGTPRRTRPPAGRPSWSCRGWAPSPRSLAPHLDRAVSRAGNAPLDQQEVSLRIDLDHLEPALGDPLAAHATGHLHALEHARRVGAGADRAGGAHVVRAVRGGAAGEVVAPDGSLEALADRDPGDLHLLAGLELLHGKHLADLMLLGLAELHQR